jgi:hypothetical protein
MAVDAVGRDVEGAVLEPLIETSGLAKEQFLTREYGLIQSIRLPCSPQNVSGSLLHASYMARYIASSIKADSATLGKLLKD